MNPVYSYKSHVTSPFQAFGHSPPVYWGTVCVTSTNSTIQHSEYTLSPFEWQHGTWKPETDPRDPTARNLIPEISYPESDIRNLIPETRRWDEAIAISEGKNRPETEELKTSYLQWLLMTSQEEKAAKFITRNPDTRSHTRNLTRNQTRTPRPQIRNPRNHTRNPRPET